MPRIDKQECFNVFDAKSRDVANLDNLKTKLFLISIVSKILFLSLDYISLQYKLRKSISCVFDTCITLIDYFKLLIIAKYNRIIATFINLNILKYRITKSLKKEFYSQY